MKERNECFRKFCKAKDAFFENIRHHIKKKLVFLKKNCSNYFERDKFNYSQILQGIESIASPKNKNSFIPTSLKKI